MNSSAEPDSNAGPRFTRTPAIWYSYTMLGFFTYLLNIQGNIVPFLRSELNLSYRTVSLHSSAVAAGLLVVGLVGDRVLRRLGRRGTYWLGAGGTALGMLILCVAPVAWVSITGFALLGLVGGLIPVVVVAVLADIPARWRCVAFAESNAMSYVFAVMAPLLMGLSVFLDLNWRMPILVGVAAGVIIVLLHRDTVLVDAPTAPNSKTPPLNAAYWAYWLLLAFGVAMEFCVLIWSPEFLEHVVGFSKAGAATAAATFFAAVLIGRLLGSVALRVVAAHLLYVIALGVTFIGFLVYWGVQGPVAAVAGLFILGLGIAQFYPLSASFAVRAAGLAGDKGSSRLMTAVGLAVISMPALMGALADDFGLRLAHLALPALVAGATCCFFVAQTLQKRVAV